MNINMNTVKTNKYILLVVALVLIPFFLLLLRQLVKYGPSTRSQPIANPTPVVQKQSPTPTLTLEEQGRIQTQADFDYGQKQKAVIDNYPWYNSLPISSGSYFVYFDISSKKFIAKIYPQKGAREKDDTLSIELQVKAMLTALGVNLDTYKIDWQVFPK